MNAAGYILALALFGFGLVGMAVWCDTYHDHTAEEAE